MITILLLLMGIVLLSLGILMLKYANAEPDQYVWVGNGKNPFE
jgi:hypothetical protein